MSAFLNFRCSEIYGDLIAGIRMTQAAFIISMSAPKCNVDINLKKSRKKQDVSLAFGFLT